MLGTTLVRPEVIGLGAQLCRYAQCISSVDHALPGDDQEEGEVAILHSSILTLPGSWLSGTLTSSYFYKTLFVLASLIVVFRSSYSLYISV